MTIILITLIATLISCTTAGHHPSKNAKSTPKDNQSQVVSLAEIASDIGEKGTGNLILMNGIQDQWLPPMEIKRDNFAQRVNEIATLTHFALQETPHYQFLYAPGYTSLTETNLQGSLDPTYQTMQLPVVFGFDTPLFGAFALIGKALNITVIADNIVAAGKTGTIALADVPLDIAIEGIIKSARIPSGLFQIESTPDYIFLRAQQNTAKTPTLINGDALSPEQQAKLDTRVDIMLPESIKDSAHIDLRMGAQNLARVLPTLSKQLGIPVTTSSELSDLPINLCVMNHVPIRTAMDLLIRQWPLPLYGYEFDGATITIRLRPQG